MPMIGLYGAGNLGRYIGSRMSKPFVFVDDTPEKQNTTIDGKPVLSLKDFARQADSEYRLYSCIMQNCYDYPNRREQIKKQYRLDLQPFPPLLLSLGGTWHFYEPQAQLRKKRERYLRLEQTLADQESVHCLRGHLELRESGNLAALKLAPLKQQDFLMKHLPNNINYVDIGAYDGDTIENFISQRQSRFQHIWAVEPDSTNRQRLYNRLSQRLGEKLTVLPYAISAAEGEARKFLQTGEMHSRLVPDLIHTKSSHADIQTIQTCTLEGLNIPSPACYCIDIEGEDTSVVISSLDWVRRTHPFLWLSAYHYPDDLLILFEAIHELKIGYRFYLRCYCNDGFDLMLFCLPDK